jgi:hypothetical protein
MIHGPAIRPIDGIELPIRLYAGCIVVEPMFKLSDARGAICDLMDRTNERRTVSFNAGYEGLMLRSSA